LCNILLVSAENHINTKLVRHRNCKANMADKDDDNSISTEDIEDGDSNTSTKDEIKVDNVAANSSINSNTLYYIFNNDKITK
jgi:hypothetical protein